MRDRTGPTVIDVLTMAWVKPFSTKSDFGRANANVVAMLASDGHLTTRVAAGLYSHQWRVTPEGLAHLYALNGMTGEPPNV